ncbi:hypothetical protein [Streptomyces sp. NPDC090445]|uniref:hypothetical protein n=1 Tax=Streptomyces sp. NPDC090445 TaxID=3365963 RepID=UPI00380FA2E4
MIEALAARAPQQLVPVRSLVAARQHRAVAFARICYDHLGGSLSVAITDAMTEQGFLDWEFGPVLTPPGAAWLTDTGITQETAPHVRTCLDWTERRLHLRARSPQPYSTMQFRSPGSCRPEAPASCG